MYNVKYLDERVNQNDQHTNDTNIKPEDTFN